MAKKRLEPHELREFNYTHTKDAVGDYGEHKIAELVSGIIRNPKVSRPFLPLTKSWSPISWADISIPSINTELEVKMRYFSQSVYIWLSQFGEMNIRSKEYFIDQYYALWFYKTKSWKRVGNITPIGKMMTEYEVKKAQIAFIRQVQIQNCFIFPHTFVWDYFRRRDIWWRTRKYWGSVWSSNIWPIKESFDNFEGRDKVSLTFRGFSPSRPHMNLHVIWWEMIDHIFEVHKTTGMIISS